MVMTKQQFHQIPFKRKMSMSTSHMFAVEWLPDFYGFHFFFVYAIFYNIYCYLIHHRVRIIFVDQNIFFNKTLISLIL